MGIKCKINKKSGFGAFLDFKRFHTFLPFMVTKIATLYLCLGLKCKKVFRSRKIDLLCLQETDVKGGFDKGLCEI